jgi:hypothetical protein
MPQEERRLMFVVHTLVSLTIIAVLAFFVLFAAEKADGLIKIFGRVLGVWLLILAVLAAAGAAAAPMMGGRPFGMEMRRHMRDAHCYWQREESDRTAPPAPAAPSEPAAPTN